MPVYADPEDAPGAFAGRLEDHLDQLTTVATIHDAPGRVLIPGEPEVRAEERAAERGIVVDRAHSLGLHGLGVRFGVAFPADVPGVG